MSYGKNSRNQNIDFDQRRHHAQGRDDNRYQGPRRYVVNPRNQILGHEDRILACKELMAGEPGVYSLFDADFTVEQHNSGGFMVVRYLGGTSTCELRTGGLRDGFFVPLGAFWGATSKPDYNFKDDDQAFLVKFLLFQQAMQEAVKLLKAERSKQRHNLIEDVRAKYGQVSTVVKPPKAGPPRIARLEQLLTVNYGVFRHESGVDIVVASGPGKRGQAFWAQNAVEGHPLTAVADGNIFAMAYDVKTYANEQSNPVEGKALLARVFRQWLREVFRKDGLLPPADEQMKDASPATAIARMASVNAEHEHAEALSESSTNVIDIHDGGTKPRMRTPRKAKT